MCENMLRERHLLEEEDKGVYLLLSPPVDDHDGDNGWLIAIGDVDDDRITPIVITGQRQRIAFI